MNEPAELSVSEARDRFSDAVNRAAYGGEVTYITRGRGRARSAAIVPITLVEDYEALLDQEDVREARRLLESLRAGRETTVSADELYRELGL